MSHRAAVVHSHLLQALGGQSGRGHCQVEHFCDGRSYRAFVFHGVAQCHVVGYYAALPVGRVRKVVEPRFAGKRMRKLDCVAYGVNVLCRCLQVRVNPDAARFAGFYACGLGQCRGRAYSDRQQYHVGNDAFAAFQVCRQAVSVAAEACHSFFKVQRNALVGKVLVDWSSH